MKTTLTTAFAFALMTIGFAGFTLVPAEAQENLNQAETTGGDGKTAVDSHSDDSNFAEDWLSWLNPNWFDTEGNDSELAGFQYCENDDIFCPDNGWNNPDQVDNERTVAVERESGPATAASCTDAADCIGGSPAQGGSAAETSNDRVARTGYY